MKEIKHIKWFDSYGVSAGWEDISDFQPNELIVESVGFVLYEDDNVISLTGNYAEETDRTLKQANGIITIPKCCIKEITSVSPNRHKLPLRSNLRKGGYCQNTHDKAIPVIDSRKLSPEDFKNIRELRNP